MRKRCYATIVAELAIAAVATACSGQPASPTAAAPTLAPTSAAVKATAAPSATPVPQSATPAPATTAAPTAAPTVASVAAPTAAPTSASQAATAAPRFTHPTEITNPYYPISLIGHTIELGQDGQTFGVEVTLLSGTKIIAWGGQQTEARVAQFVAYTDSKLVEVAYDYFAQSDDGGVYYMGEDVVITRMGRSPTTEDHGWPARIARRRR